MLIWIVGFGTVGQWLVRALDSQAGRLAARYGVRFTVVGLASARDGLIYHQGGLDLPAILRHGSGRTPDTGHRTPGCRASCRRVSCAGRPPSRACAPPRLTFLLRLRAAVRRRGARPHPYARGARSRHPGSHLQQVARCPARHRACGAGPSPRGTVARRVHCHVGHAASQHARRRAGRRDPGRALRGILNATANVILSDMAAGKPYQEALADAQQAGLAERDPAADVERHDAVAKVMILAALVFGRQLRRDELSCRGITDIAQAELDKAAASGGRLRHVATLEFSGARPSR